MKLQFEETNYAQILSECPFNEIHEIKEIPKYLKEIEYDSDPKVRVYFLKGLFSTNDELRGGIPKVTNRHGKGGRARDRIED